MHIEIEPAIHYWGTPVLLDGSDHIDPKKWHPLFMSFRQFYGRGDQVRQSRLAEGSEDRYAPWKLQGVKRLAGKMLSKWEHHRYGP